MRSHGIATLVGLTVLFGAGVASGAVVEIGPADDIVDAVAALQPGDELVLQGGTYNMNRRFGVSIKGTAAAPIIIRAKDGEHPIIKRSDANQNTIDIDDGEYLVFRGLEVDGGSHGIRIVRARFVTIEDCEIHNTADVALSANSGGPYEALVIRRNNIHHTHDTGEGMYLGCNDNGCQVFDSIIEQNHVHHTNSADVRQGDGIELKEGSYNNIIRDNVIHDTNYPCILTYSVVGNGGPNIIERNVMWNCGNHAIQSAADATIRNNIILGANVDGIAMQPHQAGAPSNMIVTHNTVLNTGDAISLRGSTGSVIIANNAVYSQGGDAIFVNGDTSQLTLAGNVGVGGLSGANGGYTDGDLAADFVSANYSGTPPIDVFPAPGSALIGAGDAAHVADDDFNGNLRNGVADVGAYLFADTGNPGWVIGEAFKGDLVGPGTGGTGGSGGATGGSGGTGGGTAGAGANVAAYPTEEDSSGCACRTGSTSSVAWGAAGWLLALGLAGLRRRRVYRAAI